MEITRESLKKRLDDIQNYNISNHKETEKTLKKLSESSNLHALFSEVRKDDEWLEAIAERSYTHNNGFDKIKLIASDNPSYKLRLHIWWPERLPQSAADVDIHDHRWDFTSTIISGKMKFMNFDISDEGRLVHEYTYPRRDEGEDYELIYEGENTLKEQFGGVLREGVTYYISNENIHHTFVPEKTLTSTLLIQSPDNKETAKIFTQKERSEESGEVSQMTPEGVISNINRLEDHIR